MSDRPLLSAPAKALRVSREGSETPLERELICEHRLMLSVDGAAFAQLVCTRSMLRQLILGRLCTAGRIRAPKDVIAMRFSENEDRAEVTLRPGAGSDRPRNLTDQSRWSSEDIYRLAARARTSMPLHDATQGTHGCLLLHRGEVLCCCEDIGRHNAIDKAVGEALVRGIPTCECVLYTTGRIAVDIVEKTATAGVGVLATRALPTAEALALAKTLGLTLICRAWEEQYEVYADGTEGQGL